jgi:hypothetical protein
MEWVSRAWVDADRPHWVEEDTGQVVEEACTLVGLRCELYHYELINKRYQITYVASDPYSGKTSLKMVNAQLKILARAKWKLTLAIGRRHTRWIMHCLHVWPRHISSGWARRRHPRHHGLRARIRLTII